jgi:hypothetical protein
MGGREKVGWVVRGENLGKGGKKTRENCRFSDGKEGLGHEATG